MLTLPECAGSRYKQYNFIICNFGTNMNKIILKQMRNTRIEYGKMLPVDLVWVKWQGY